MFNIDKRSKILNTSIISPAVLGKGLKNILDEIKSYSKKGKQHILFSDYQLTYGKNLSTNINIPYVKNNIVRDLLIINHPDDAERLTNNHIKKHPILEPLLYNTNEKFLIKHLVLTQNLKNLFQFLLKDPNIV